MQVVKYERVIWFTSDTDRRERPGRGSFFVRIVFFSFCCCILSTFVVLVLYTAGRDCQRSRCSLEKKGNGGRGRLNGPANWGSSGVAAPTRRRKGAGSLYRGLKASYLPSFPVPT